MTQQRAAMQMALEALRASQVRDSNFATDLAITALREALENNELVDVALINEGNMAQPQVAPDGRVAKTVFTFEDMQKATEMGYESGKAEAEALAQPQGEWVDLLDDEKYDLWCEFHNSEGKPIKRGYDDCIIAKFKEKNTPPFVPQGEPVAWDQPYWQVFNTGACVAEGLTMAEAKEYLDGNRFARGWTAVFCHVVHSEREWPSTTPPSVEAAIEATKEKAAKVCADLVVPWDENTPNGELIAIRNSGMVDCAAAIRSMK